MSARILLPALAWLAAASAAAAAPPPYDPVRFAFPGSVHSPAEGASAGLAGADRWLSAMPGGNPAAAAAASAVTVSPILQRISRQDLSAANREFSQTTFFPDASSGQLALRRGAWALRLEGAQPVLRRETSTFSVAIGGGVTQPARVRVDADTREQRAALAVSRGQGAWRWGAAAEFTRRSDRYATREVSGSPESGDRELAFEATGAGGSLGFTWARAADRRWGWETGAAWRWIGALSGDYTSQSDLLTGTSRITGDAGRDATWEGGVSVRVTVDERGGHAWASLEGRGAERWPGLGLETEPAASWRFGYAYRDRETPWAVRAGIGQDVQPGTPEPRADVLGLGLGWRQEDLGVDVGITHRSIRRGESPTQADTRLVASISVGF